MSRVVGVEFEPRASAASEIRRGTRRISPPPYPTQSAGYFVSVRGGGWGSYLGDGGLDVAGVGGGHRLADDGVIGAHLDVADGDGPVGSNRGCEARSAAGPSARKSARDDAPVGTAVACVGRITRSWATKGAWLWTRTTRTWSSCGRSWCCPRSRGPRGGRHRKGPPRRRSRSWARCSPRGRASPWHEPLWRSSSRDA